MGAEPAVEGLFTTIRLALWGILLAASSAR
jgi:hypothetical protein